MAPSKRKSDRSRRSWTQREETTLIAAVKDIIQNGWKSDNGFRSGYLNKLEKMMRKDFPETDLKAIPHIYSKMTSWKKSYHLLNTILSRSGVGWNLRGDYTFEIEDDQWDQITEVEPNARLMRFKPWPYYEDWKQMFGEDRATGENAEDMADAAADLRANDPPIQAPVAEEDEEMSYDTEDFDRAASRGSQNAAEYPQQRQKAKRRKMSEEIQVVCSLLKEMNNGTNLRLEKVANRMGSEFDIGKARQETLQQLREIPGLSRANMYHVLEILAFKVERLEIWKAMDDKARVEYVDHLLQLRRADT